MPRQKKQRCIANPPFFEGYKPVGISNYLLEEITLKPEEYEAIRLADYENLKQEDAAKKLDVSRPTFTRIYNSARKKIALAFVEGKMLSFITKNDTVTNNNECRKKTLSECISCGYTMNTCKKNITCPQCGNRMIFININKNNKMKKIAIPYENGLLCAHFGGAPQFIIYHVEDNKVINKEIFNAPPHEPGALPRWIGSQGVTDVIAGGMGEKAVTIFNHLGIKAHVGAQHSSTDDVVEHFLNSSLSLTAEPCKHDHHKGEGNGDNCGNH